MKLRALVGQNGIYLDSMINIHNLENTDDITYLFNSPFITLVMIVWNKKAGEDVTVQK